MRISSAAALGRIAGLEASLNAQEPPIEADGRSGGAGSALALDPALIVALLFRSDRCRQIFAGAKKWIKGASLQIGRAVTNSW